jgi:hypothetical protein
MGSFHVNLLISCESALKNSMKMTFRLLLEEFVDHLISIN